MKIGILFLWASILFVGCAKEDTEMNGLRGPAIRDIKNNNGDLADTPKSTPPQAVGFYADGNLINDFEFPLEGLGYLKVFRARHRNFITNNLHSTIAEASKKIAVKYPGGERLQVGDIAKSGGGQLSLHASHQNGLDADIAYYRLNHKEMNPEPFGGFDEIFVKRGQVTTNFDLERNFEIMKLFVETKGVNRIFVDAAIKTKMCNLLKDKTLTALETETLRRLRPLTNHDDHMHLRIKCPSTSPDCITQQEPPAGTSCPKAGQVLFNMFDPGVE